MKRMLLLAVIVISSLNVFSQSKLSLQFNGSAGGFKDNFFGVGNRYYEAGFSYKIEPRIYYEVLKDFRVGLGIGYLSNTSRRDIIDHLEPSDPNDPSVFQGKLVTISYNYTYFTIPISVKYDINLTKSLFLPLEVNGTYNNFLEAKNKNSVNNSYQNVEMSNFNSPFSIGAATGLGYKLSPKVSFEGNLIYTLQLSNIHDGITNATLPEFNNIPMKGKYTIWGGIGINYKL
ncbi:PorT family protein [Solitalea sp. MAHUQ-68]|uniref:PorT family protein n=1 Tax=Solitalea agri TaxID=2953739 RepID=A0A9X2JCJ5_9SPHI|nr:outer membrane beta-barrel protein [Solitalea agri]MCO4291865.1 PorT family protein [Solitalea agri]